MIGFYDLKRYPNLVMSDMKHPLKDKMTKCHGITNKRSLEDKNSY